MFVKIGLCRGTSTKEKPLPSGDVIKEHYVLIVSEGKDEFGQSVDITTGIRIGKGHYEAGIARLYDNLKDKQIAVPFFPKAWKAKSGTVGLEYWLGGEGKPLNLAPAPPKLAEAS